MRKHLGKYIPIQLTTFIAAMLVCATTLNAETLYDVTASPETAVFTSGQDGYDTYRIPTIVQGTDNVLYAFAEGRKNSSTDSGNIDIVMKTSADGGSTWGSMSVIRNAGADTAGNPSPVVDAATGRISLLYCVNCNAMYSTYSDDGGNTWSNSKAVSTAALGTDGTRVYTGPAHGIQLTRGENAGRLIVGGCYRSSLSPDCNYGSCILYSDDGGRSWLLGATDTHSGDSDVRPLENVAVELVDGRIYMNARDQYGSSAATRAVTHSSDGGLSFDSPFIASPGIDTPVVQNSAIRFAAVDQGDAANILAYSAPHSTDNSRQDMTLYLSLDEGESWNHAIQLNDGRAAYSDLVKIDGTHVGLLYETGSYDEIVFNRIAITPIPEPSTAVILGTGLSGLAIMWRVKGRGSILRRHGLSARNCIRFRRCGHGCRNIIRGRLFAK